MGDFTAVKSLAFAGGNGAQASGSGLELEQLTHRWCPAPRQKRGRKARQALEFIRRSSPFFLHHGADQVAALGDVDGGLQQIGKRQLAKALTQGHPAADSTWHSDCIHAALGRRTAVAAIFALEILGCPALRRTAGCIEPVQFLAVPHHTKRVAAQTIADRLHNGHGGCRSDSRVHCVAAKEPHAQAGLCRQRVRGRHHIAGKQRRAGGSVGVVKVKLHVVIIRGLESNRLRPAHNDRQARPGFYSVALVAEVATGLIDDSRPAAALADSR